MYFNIPNCFKFLNKIKENNNTQYGKPNYNLFNLLRRAYLKAFKNIPLRIFKMKTS